MRKIFLIVIIILGVWAFLIEPSILKVSIINLKNNHLKGLKVVFIGDLHVKPYQKKHLKNIVKKISEQHPDLILCIGDFVSGHKKSQSLSIEEITQELSVLKPKYGFYTTLGNHDWWQGGENIEKVLEESGIIVLGNENITININDKKLCIAGIEDLSTKGVDIEKALKNIHQPSILLSHSPDVFPLINKQNKIDLVLAGHTHGGQVRFPFIGPLIVPSDYGNKYAQGLIEESNHIMFVTKGIGTSIIPVRFNCTPEIVVINFN